MESIPAIIADFNETSTTIIVEVEKVIKNYNRDLTVGRLNQTVDVYVLRAGSLEINPEEGELEEARAALQKYLMGSLDAEEGELVVRLSGKCLEKKPVKEKKQRSPSQEEKCGE